MEILKFLGQHSRRLTGWSIVAGVLSGISNAVLLGVINSAMKRDGASVASLAWCFAGLCLVLPGTRYLSELLLNKLGQNALYDLRMTISRQVLAAPLRHLELIGPARIMAAMTEDIPNIAGVLLVIPMLCVNTATVLSCVIYMGWLSWKLLSVVLLFMVLGTLSYLAPVERALRMFKRARENSDAMLEHFRALTQGTKELKIHRDRRDAFLNTIMDGTAQSLRGHNISAMKVYVAAASWGQVLMFILIGIIVFLLPSLWKLSPAVIAGYTITLLYFISPLQYVLNTIPTLSRTRVALDNLRELGFSLNSHGTEDVEPLLPATAAWRRLEVSSVTHSYIRESDDHNFILGPISLTLVPGEIVFIVGGNGSGKTTLAKLLIGLYAPEQGCIYMDGAPIVSQADRECYRQNFSVVFSDVYLFDRLLGLSGIELNARAQQYLEQLNLADKVTIKDGRLSTLELSQGQRKRLALLTAYLEDRPIYVFDEWAADQDPQFKNIFYLRLLPELKMRNKAVIVISHDDRYYHIADRVIKLEMGQIASIESHTHDAAADMHA
jgi:putative ATP-binding cassette transporter